MLADMEATSQIVPVDLRNSAQAVREQLTVLKL
jgi:hypothetical protein